MGYNVARNSIGTLHNAPLASALGQELHPPIFSTLVMHGIQVKIKIEIVQCSEVKINMDLNACVILHPLSSLELSILDSGDLRTQIP